MSDPEILHQEESFVVLNKPAFSEAADAPASMRAFMARMEARLGASLQPVHRPEPESSGVFLCALDKPSLDALSGQFQSKSVVRRHLALCWILPREQCRFPFDLVREADESLPAAFDMDLGLDKDPSDPSRMKVFRRKGGMAARTHFEVLERFQRLALIACFPETGRRHQLRVHLCGAGLPVLNDGIYGDASQTLLLSSLKRGYKGRVDERPLIRRLALHAEAFTFKHPNSKESLTVTAPLPDDFELALKNLRRFQGAVRRT